MFLTKPIKKIKGLFDYYRNGQVVPAEEYNANTTAFREAIEHNGKVLEEHEAAFKDLTVAGLPKGGLQTEFIADEAVTVDKLASDIQNQMLLTPETVGAYFRDFLVQHHKSKPDMQGVFMNGAVTGVNQTLTRQSTYIKTVEHTAEGYLVIVNPDGEYSDDWIHVPYTNPAQPETYLVEIPERYLSKRVKGCGFGWKTRYVLDQAYDIDTTTDLFVVMWDTVYQTEMNSTSYRTGRSSCVIRFKDANGALIASLPIMSLKTYHTPQTACRSVEGTDISEIPAQVFKNVQIIEIDTTWSDYTYSSKSTARYHMRADTQPSLTVNMRFGTGTSEHLSYVTTLPVTNMLNYVAIGAYVKATTAVDFDTYKLNLAPYCVGTCPYQPAPGFEKQVLAYISDTADSKYESTLTNDSTHQYYIRHDFQAPLIISARISTNKPADLHPEFVAGEYYSWPLNFTDNTYIAYANVSDVISALKTYFEDHIEDITYTEYTLGTAQLGLQFDTTTNNITIESVSVAKYPGFAKPNIEGATSFNLRRSSL